MCNIRIPEKVACSCLLHKILASVRSILFSINDNTDFAIVNTFLPQNENCIVIHYSATSAIHYCSPRKSIFKVSTIEFRRGKLTHLRTEDTFATARRRCGITKPEIASESNSSQLSSTALPLVKRKLVVYILYSRHGSLQSPHTDVGNSFLCEIEEAFRFVLHEGEEGVLLNEDAIIRLHQRFLL
ncbi:hypothetical protein ALC57_11846 [Trachymyrmex cornetzi]|uniref:Uncharacterized protein n=1 Tax=Trachymyrmex cornetzi TaxID=471704 RepID=A0A195DSQ4_9HYME|nr:hypothetical protein ALC57_11846 [Trachymyrmex cornetzi]